MTIPGGENVSITIDMDKRCAECDKGGATESGICLRCIIKTMGNKPLKSREAIAFRQRMQQLRTNHARR